MHRAVLRRSLSAAFSEAVLVLGFGAGEGVGGVIARMDASGDSAET